MVVEEGVVVVVEVEVVVGLIKVFVVEGVGEEIVVVEEEGCFGVVFRREGLV